MTRTVVRRTSGALIVVVLLALAWTVVFGQTREVPMPAEDASPHEVVVAFLDALDARDCGTARAIVVDGSSRADTWCSEVGSVEDVSFSGAGDSQIVGPYPQHARVAVDFTVHWQPFNGGHFIGSETHLVGWSYYLVRSAEREPWRIESEGKG